MSQVHLIVAQFAILAYVLVTRLSTETASTVLIPCVDSALCEPGARHRSSSCARHTLSTPNVNRALTDRIQYQAVC
jgi:hypothetical protein